MFTSEELRYLEHLVLNKINYGGTVDEMEMYLSIYHKINQKKKQ